MKKNYNDPQYEIFGVSTNDFLASSTDPDNFQDNTVPSIPGNDIPTIM